MPTPRFQDYRNPRPVDATPCRCSNSANNAISQTSRPGAAGGAALAATAATKCRAAGTGGNAIDPPGKTAAPTARPNSANLPPTGTNARESTEFPPRAATLCPIAAYNRRAAPIPGRQSNGNAAIPASARA